MIYDMIIIDYSLKIMMNWWSSQIYHTTFPRGCYLKNGNYQADMDLALLEITASLVLADGSSSVVAAFFAAASLAFCPSLFFCVWWLANVQLDIQIIPYDDVDVLLDCQEILPAKNDWLNGSTYQMQCVSTALDSWQVCVLRR